MAYLIVFGNLLAAVVVSLVLVRLIWFIPSVKKFQEIAVYNEIIEKSSDEINEQPLLADFTDSDDAYLFEAIKLLVKHEPSRAAAILIALEPDLSRLRKDMLKLGGSAERAFHKSAEDGIEYIMKVAPISWVTDLWQKASHKRDQIWLFKYLFKNKAKPFLLHDEFSDKISVECGRETLFLKASRKEHNTLRSINRTLVTNQYVSEANRHSISPIYDIVPPVRSRSWTRYTGRAYLAHMESSLEQSQRNIGTLVKRKIDLVVREELGR